MKRNKLRILLHTQYYPPEIGAPQNRLADLAQVLMERGFIVSVLTAFPNYPIGKLYPGYKGVFRKEHLNGVTIYRSLIIPSKSASFPSRMLNYFSFLASSLIFGLTLPRQDVLITESPPLFLGFSSYIISRAKRAKWIFNVADLWPASVVELGLLRENSTLHRLSRRLESFFYRKAWLVTGQSMSILEDIHSRFPEVMTYHLSNGVDPSKYEPLQNKQNEELEERIKIVYAGLHGIAQGLEQIVDLAKELKDDKKTFFELYGDGPEKETLIALAAQYALTNLVFHDPVPKDTVAELLAQADILLVPLKTHLTGAVPSKLYEAMAAGKPVILIAEGEAARIVNESNCGIAVHPGDLQELVNATRHLAGNPMTRIEMGKNGRKTVYENYNRKNIMNGFVTFLMDRLG